MTERYRFGGPIPESVQRLKQRREYRTSQLCQMIKRGRWQARLDNPPPGWEQVLNGFGVVTSLRPPLPWIEPADSAGAELLSPVMRGGADAKTCL